MNDKTARKIIKSKGGGKERIVIWRRVLLFAMSIVGALGISLAPVSNVFATSVYDDLITPTSTISIKNPTDSPVDITGSVLTIMNASCNSDYVAYTNALSDEDGKWVIAEQYDGPSNTISVLVAWSTDPNAKLHWSTDGWATSVRADVDGDVLLYMPESSTTPDCSSHSSSSTSIISDSLWPGTQKVFISTYPPNYPSGYEGETIPGDADGDGLSTLQEAAQSTSDNDRDSDADGLSDYVESEWNPYYDETFCKQTSPYTCADPNPLEKDLFIEIDWMDDNIHAPYKPSSTQLGMVENMLANKGINVYFDLGEYGGGNQLPGYSSDINWFETVGQLDVHDFKYGGDVLDTGLQTSLPSQFNYEYREDVWRYMVYGVEEISDLELVAQQTGDTVGGAAEAIGDDSVIASENYDFFDDNKFAYSADRARAGVLAHEIGHLLCLSSVHRYVEQDEDCAFDDVDKEGSEDYLSVMNYTYAFPEEEGLEAVNYSDGTNGVGDHDDWSAILEGMGGFIYNGDFTNIPTLISSSNGNMDKRDKIHIKHHGDDMPTIGGEAQARIRSSVKTRVLNHNF